MENETLIKDEENLKKENETLIKDKENLKNQNETLIKDKKNLIKEKNDLNSKITALNNEIVIFKADIEQKNIDQALANENLQILKKENLDLKNMLDSTSQDLNDQLRNKNTEIENCLKEIQELKTVIENIVSNNETRQKDFENQKSEIMHNNQIEINKLEEKLIKIENLNFVMKKENCDKYDIIFNLNSMKKIFNKGIEIEILNSELYEKMKLTNMVVVGVLGNYKNGKSFILRNILNFPIYHSFYDRTKGISIKYSDKENKRIAIIDNIGYENPAEINDSSDNQEDFFTCRSVKEKVVECKENKLEKGINSYILSRVN